MVTATLPLHAAPETRVKVKVEFALMGDTAEGGLLPGGYFARRHAGLKVQEGGYAAFPRLVHLQAEDIDLPPPAAPIVDFDNSGYSIDRPLIPIEDGQRVHFRNVLAQGLTIDLRDGDAQGPVVRSIEVAPGAQADFDLGAQAVLDFRIREYPHMRTTLVRVNSPYHQIVHGNAPPEFLFAKLRPGKYRFATFAAGRWFKGRYRFSLRANANYALNVGVSGQFRSVEEGLEESGSGGTRAVRGQYTGEEPSAPAPNRAPVAGSGDPRIPDRVQPDRPVPRVPAPRLPPGTVSSPPGRVPPVVPTAPTVPEPDDEEELDPGDTVKVKTVGGKGIKVTTPKPP